LFNVVRKKNLQLDREDKEKVDEVQHTILKSITIMLNSHQMRYRNRLRKTNTKNLNEDQAECDLNITKIELIKPRDQ
jgi:hypothetical protein